MRLVLAALLVVASCRPPGWDRRDDGSGVDAAGGPDGTTTTTDAGPDAATSCTQSFRLEGHAGASSVVLTGSFSNWAANPPDAISLVLGGDGAWTGSHTFAPGLHQYKFVVSGNQWIADPANPDGVDDGFGGRNSLYSCVP